MDIKKFIRSQKFRDILIILLVVFVALLIFQAGVTVGERRARFADRFGGNFERNFREPNNKKMPFRNMPNKELPGGHGAVGEIISIALPDIVVSGPDNLEKTITINERTVIRKFQNEVTDNDLQLGDHLITFGEPSETGQIQARLIRILPPPTGLPNNLPTSR